MSSFFGGIDLIKVHVITERALSNFLAAASAFRDRAIVRAKESSHVEPKLLNAINSACTKSYDDSFAYRLFYNLRNYSQHHASPLDVIPLQGTRGDDDQMNKKVRIELRRDALLKGRKMQPRVLKELEAEAEAIPLIPLASRFMNCHGIIILAMINSRHEKFARFSAYARAVTERMNVPKGATPVIWEGPPMEKAWQMSRLICIAFPLMNFAF